MTQYARSRNTQTIFVQSADPEDLQNRVNAAIAQVAALGAVEEDILAITGITLAGAGDGFTFVVAIDYANVSAEDVIGGDAPLVGATPNPVVRCYAAGDAEQLQVARAAVVAPADVSSISYLLADDQVQGASKGTRFMGMSVYMFAGLPLGSEGPFGIANLNTPQDIAAATPEFAVFQTISLNTGQFALADAGASIEYTGIQAVATGLYASVSITAGDNDMAVTLELVQDPTGTPIVLATMTTNVETDEETENIAMYGVINFAPPTTKLGLRVTTSTASTIQDVQLFMNPL